MPDFQELCGIERVRVMRSATFVSCVTRFNRNDNLIIVTENDEYGHQSQPRATGNLQPHLAPIVRIHSVFEKIRHSLMPMYEHPLDREVRYWSGIVTAYENEQNDVDHEARMIFEEWKKIGLDLPFSAAVERARREQLERARGKQREAVFARAQGRSQVDQFLSTVDFTSREDAMREWRPLHGHATPYPNSVIFNQPATDLGGHAEENLIRSWDSVTQGIVLDHVDIFLTRMPCASRSEPMRLGVTVFKEGCVNKLIQLVALIGGNVTWNIVWDQELSAPGAQALSQALAAGFPPRVTFSRFDAWWRRDLETQTNAPW